MDSVRSEVDEVKSCSLCKKAKSLSDFEKRKEVKSGRGARCKSCRVLYLQRRKKKVLDYYGGKCVCCGINDYRFLVLDHKNNDGSLRRSGSTAANEIARAIREGFPKDLQVLCWNCNAAKWMYGVCPHESGQEIDLEY